MKDPGNRMLGLMLILTFLVLLLYNFNEPLPDSGYDLPAEPESGDILGLDYNDPTKWRTTTPNSHNNGHVGSSRFALGDSLDDIIDERINRAIIDRERELNPSRVPGYWGEQEYIPYKPENIK